MNTDQTADQELILLGIAKERANRADEIPYVEETVKQILQNSAIDATVSSRLKSVDRILEKMLLKAKSYDKITDIAGLRIVTNDAEDCYRVLEMLHSKFQYKKDEFDDYIKNPKPNSYQSIHTTIVTPRDQLVEVQIRTKKMHENAENGMASHIEYKTDNKRKTKEIIEKIKDSFEGIANIIKL